MMALVVLWFLAIFDISSSEGEQKTQQPTEEWRGYSIAFHLLLPVAGFCILWGRRDLLNKLLQHVDRNCISVFCPSFSKRQKLLKWAVENLPTTWSSSSRTLSGGIPDLWKDGSLMCTLINMAIPGACQNPPKHWKKPPTHAQALAYKYLDITPIFRESDFKDPFTPNQERKFLVYLQELQQAIRSRTYKESPPKFSQNYIAKGMGLQNGEQYKKTTFYVYSNTKNANCSNVLAYIRGPYGTQGTATIPAFYNTNAPSNLNSLNKQYKSMDKIVFKKEARKSFLKSIALDFSSLVNFDRKSVLNDIPIHVEIETDRAKVSYIPLNYGIYEINLITNGELLANSPFAVSISKNTVGTRDSFDTTEKVLQELPSVKKRRILSRFIDCIDEKIPLDKDDSGNSSASDESRHGSHLETSMLDETESLAPLTKTQVVKSESDINFIDKDIDTKGEQDINVRSFGKTVKFTETDKLLPILSVTEADENVSEKLEDQNDFESKESEIVHDDYINVTASNKSEYELRVTHDYTEEGPRQVSLPEISLSPENYFENNIMVASISNEQSTNPHDIKQEFNQISSRKTDAQVNLNTGSDDVPSAAIKNVSTTTLDRDPSCTEEHVQKRPTSIVTPFLITLNSVEKPLVRSSEENDHRHVVSSERDTVIKIENHDNGNSTHHSKKIQEIPSPEKLTLAKSNLENSYVERLKAILIEKLTESENTKTIKNLVNTSNKLKSMNKKPYRPDENNNACQENSLRDASPICPVHIAPEVETHSSSKPVVIPVSEKRKLFARQTCLSISNSANSSFSEKESEDVAKEFSEKCSLRLLSVIDTIRNSANSSLSRTISCSTPNISVSKSSTGSSSGGSKSSFLEARDYWLGLSSENFSDNSSNHPKYTVKTKNLGDSIKISCEKYRSAEDIASISRMNFNRRLTKYSSLNQKDFEAIEFISLEERKKLLLQDQYEKEKMKTRFVNKRVFARTKSTEINCKLQEESEDVKKIRNYFIETEPSRIAAQSVRPSKNATDAKNPELNEPKPTSQFRRAITFFRNLEKSATYKKKLPQKPKHEIKRRFSMDYVERKRNRANIGGSLRLPKTSEKFSLTKIYFDIMDNKRGTFKGAPNREALSESLASLSSKTDELLDKSENPIQYNMFLNKGKQKKRRSLKSIFNIHY